jgi:cytochrome P450
VKKDTYVDIHVSALHRNPKYWGPDAEAFRPERFDTRQGREYRRDAFVPFSDGMRSCLGKRFAQVEAVCALALICQRYKIEVADEKDRATLLDCHEKLTLTPLKHVNLRMTRRRITA